MEQEVMAMIVHMAANGVLTIPSAIRRKLGMMARTRVDMAVDNRGYKIILTPIVHKQIHRLHGKYKGKGLLKALIAEKKRR